MISSHARVGNPPGFPRVRYRPRQSDRFELVSRYSYLLEQRPTYGEQATQRERSHVLSLMPYARLPHKILLSGKLAFKRTAQLLRMTGQY